MLFILWEEWVLLLQLAEEWPSPFTAYPYGQIKFRSELADSNSRTRKYNMIHLSWYGANDIFCLLFQAKKSIYDHLSTIADYAIEMFDVLDEINYQSYNEFVLRVGTSMHAYQRQHTVSVKVWKVVHELFGLLNVPCRRRDQCWSSGGRGHRGTATSVWHLGEYGQRGQSHGQYGSTREDSGQIEKFCTFFSLFHSNAWCRVVSGMGQAEMEKKRSGNAKMWLIIHYYKIEINQFVFVFF